MENKYKGLKIATVYGKGEDGCGVTRTSAELQLWAKKVGATVDVYFFMEKSFTRSGGHNVDFKYFCSNNAVGRKFVKIDNLSQTAEKINDNYDIVMFMNYPSNKHDNQYSRDFYYEFFEKIQKPIKAFYEHDIHKGQVDKTPYLVPMLINSDVVFHFDTDTWFSTTIDKMGFQKIGERLHKYTLWMDFDELDSFRLKYLNKKKKGLVSVTRWSSLKNIGRSIEIMAHIQKKEPDWDCKVYGVERSIGAKFDILDRPDVTYVNNGGGRDGDGEVDVHGPVTRDQGLEIVASHEFSSSFFSLPRIPENYGNRMEYTQIEIVGVGTIPVFDKHWAENNKLSDGRYYIDVPYSAIYTDGSNTEEIAEKLIEISNNPEEKQKYLETSYNLVMQEFNSDIVIPKAIDLIQSIGKNKNQMSVYDICKKFVNTEFAEEIQKIEDDGKLPVLGIGEFESMEVFYLDGAKQELVKRIKSKRINNNVKALF